MFWGEKKLMEWSCSPGKGAESALKLQRALRTDPHTTERETDRQIMVGLSWDSPMSVSLSRSVTRSPSPPCAPPEPLQPAEFSVLCRDNTVNEDHHVLRPD